jgi:hypothetical protein
MRNFILFALLLLATPMFFLNPLGRPAFIGFYVGVIATWLAFMAASRSGHQTRRA